MDRSTLVYVHGYMRGHWLCSCMTSWRSLLCADGGGVGCHEAHQRLLAGGQPPRRPAAATRVGGSPGTEGSPPTSNERLVCPAAPGALSRQHSDRHPMLRASCTRLQCTQHELSWLPGHRLGLCAKVCVHLARLQHVKPARYLSCRLSPACWSTWSAARQRSRW